MLWTEKKLYGSSDKRMVTSFPGGYTIDLTFRQDARSLVKLVNGCALMEAPLTAATLEKAQELAEEKVGDWISENVARWAKTNEAFERARAGRA